MKLKFKNRDFFIPTRGFLAWLKVLGVKTTRQTLQKWVKVGVVIPPPIKKGREVLFHPQSLYPASIFGLYLGDRLVEGRGRSWRQALQSFPFLSLDDKTVKEKRHWVHLSPQEIGDLGDNWLRIIETIKYNLSLLFLTGIGQEEKTKLENEIKMLLTEVEGLQEKLKDWKTVASWLKFGLAYFEADRRAGEYLRLRRPELVDKNKNK